MPSNFQALGLGLGNREDDDRSAGKGANEKRDKKNSVIINVVTSPHVSSIHTTSPRPRASNAEQQVMLPLEDGVVEEDVVPVSAINIPPDTNIPKLSTFFRGIPKTVFRLSPRKSFGMEKELLCVWGDINVQHR